VHRLPERASYAEGALLEPLSVALHALKVGGLKLGQSCAIFGAGAIGLLLLQVVRLAGAEPVFIVDLRPFRLDQATELGAAAALDNRQGNAVEQILQMTNGLGVEFAFEAVGLPLTLQQSLQSLRKGGRAILVGLFEQPEVLLPANIFVQREISLAGSQGYNWNFQEAVKMLDARRVDLQGMITHRFSLEDVQAAFNLLADPGAETVKILVEV
jgi:(R,R)-butanediol dehydrogenase/meso-butanediol dehydrogenase/diacetyl reductase/L-iditol 2-dehydrogenase